jgi:hypothetical protein
MTVVPRREPEVAALDGGDEIDQDPRVIAIRRTAASARRCHHQRKGARARSGMREDARHAAKDLTAARGTPESLGGVARSITRPVARVAVRTM